ncbi:WhiB family transcriptional regulator [Phytoactinopolyspora endophytica]|uniref:WhiB family transcriptional regulator n=1 Tax=Phytoactinopolyspora endophytica TaxID=1642495 RepID=UPI00101B7A43|nr:WhiB family transcriptional regulator [Phytoactinopolyspora endophytica]
MTDAFWMSQAVCSDADPDLFYPPTDGRQSELQIRAARRICRDCPVRRPCFEEAFALPVVMDYGIRAGTTARERRAMRRRLQAQQAA